jgi:hypothetical protein
MNDGLRMIHNTLDFISGKKGIKMTEYTFEFKGTVSVTMKGEDTDENYDKALDEAYKSARDEILDVDNFECINVDEFTEFEKE